MKDMKENRNEAKDFSFVQERIKRQPLYQSRGFKRVLSSLVLAVICGAVACFVFVKLYPWMEEKFGEEKKTEITLPREEEDSADVKDSAAGKPPVTLPASQELELKDYKRLYEKLGELVSSCEKSLVTVTAASSDTDWFNETYESEEQICGLLVGNNGVELLVLTEYSELETADQLKVTFADKETLDAALKNYDSVTDLAVISVNLADVAQSTMESIQMAKLGSSVSLEAGDPVIAAGGPAGNMGSLIYGNLVMTGHTVSAVDGEYSLLVTDMAKTGRSSGVLLNLDGEVIGLIQRAYTSSNNKNAITAYAISDMKDVIEHLSNSQDLVYIGTKGVTVTEEAHEAEGVPYGVYVTGVEPNSPAVSAGIQNGDIITEVSGKEISNVEEIQKMLLKFSKDQVIQVKVMRQGKEGYKGITCSVALQML